MSNRKILTVASGWRISDIFKNLTTKEAIGISYGFYL